MSLLGLRKNDDIGLAGGRIPNDSNVLFSSLPRGHFAPVHGPDVTKAIQAPSIPADHVENQGTTCSGPPILLEQRRVKMF
jgi:hypothetical protein